MKRFLLLAILLVPVCKSGHAQYPFPYVGWTQGITHVGDWTTGFAESSASLSCIGDTVVNGQAYKIITSDFWQDYLVSYNNGVMRRTYNTSDTASYAIYDFNMAVGDTFQSFFSPWTYVVDSIGTQTLPNGATARYLRMQSGHEWLEGVGHLQEGFMNYTDFEGGHEIGVCTYDQNAVQIYLNPNQNYDCDSILANFNVSVPDWNAQESMRVEVYPNPASDEVSLSWNTPASVTVTVFSLTGKTLQTHAIAPSKQQLRLHVSNFEAGVYFVVISTPLGSQTKKLVVE